MKSKPKLRTAVAMLGCLFLSADHVFAAPADNSPDPFDAQDRSHWAFQKVVRPSVPSVRAAKWVRNGLDAFILAGLEARKIPPGAPADKATLLRRASLDLIGLPPMPQEVDAFIADNSPDAFDKVVDRKSTRL